MKLGLRPELTLPHSTIELDVRTLQNRATAVGVTTTERKGMILPRLQLLLHPDLHPVGDPTLSSRVVGGVRGYLTCHLPFFHLTDLP